MASFDLGETIICSCEVKDDAGAYKDPVTSMKITITGLANIVVVNNVVMTKDSVGKYHYDFDTTSINSGMYSAKYIATDGSRITIEKNSFEVK